MLNFALFNFYKIGNEIIYIHNETSLTQTINNKTGKKLTEKKTKKKTKQKLRKKKNEKNRMKIILI